MEAWFEPKVTNTASITKGCNVQKADFKFVNGATHLGNLELSFSNEDFTFTIIKLIVIGPKFVG